ncbi:flagellar export chaperone FliS [Aliamphritea hakodatensis]|uniref:flagellar export chaperone FliS n=1 Tax=Aliamphritea hakodatensis TaxID=2895352 RepID=UPI0022FD7B04|nr:flagellar export chaperone FliS [Aliamphritea hakodatensis]
MSVNLKALRQYQSVGLSTAVHAASPQQLITMLFDGVLGALAKAKGAMERNDIQGRSSQLNKATDIVLALKDYLDHEKGGEIASNLDALYDYMVRSIAEANREANAEKIQEVMDLLLTIKSGWTEMEVS